MKSMKFYYSILWLLAGVLYSAPACGQLAGSKVVDEGGSGAFKAIAATEKSLPDYVVYRPKDLAAATRNGTLPVMVFANGGCSNTSVTHERLLTEIASHGYVVIAIGPLRERLSDGPTHQTEARMLTDAIDWITAQSKESKSEYYNRVNVTKIAAGGQSCGGAQVLAVCQDPRIATCLMFNSGMGNMSMAGADKNSLKNLHTPILYLTGGPSDVAHANALVDYENISSVPVVFAALKDAGHMGTFEEPCGGSFATLALDWLDWQLKAKAENRYIFLANYLADYPGWSIKQKNFGAADTGLKAYQQLYVVQGIRYREGGSDAWQLDMAVPATYNGEKRPALVIVHGGGWAAGDKSVSVYQKMMLDYAMKGYVTINVNYRLTREADFPACIEDVKCAVRWLRAHADLFHVDPNRIATYGHSAGAHLALMLGVNDPALEGDGGWNNYSSIVNVIAAGSAPTELGRDVPMAKKEWWPIGHVTKEMPPVFIIQAEDDPVVRAVLTEDYVNKMKAIGADIEYLKMEKGGHGIAYDTNLETTEPAIEQFFKKHLK